MLSATSQYALRALAYLGRHGGQQAILGRELARSTGIPAQYLSKIMLALRHAGLVSAVRGLGGGYRLARPAQQIRLADVVEIFDGAATEPMCLLGNKRRCSELSPCSAHEAWRELRDTYLRFLHKTTLDQIAGAGREANLATVGEER